MTPIAQTLIEPNVIGVFLMLNFEVISMLEKEDKIQGLTREAAKNKLMVDGPNEVAEPEFNFYKEVLKRLWEPSAWILEVALLIEFVLGKYIQAFFVVAMLLFSAFTGAIQSRRANTVPALFSTQIKSNCFS